MARGTIRYWAAAREAVGVAEEPYEAANLGEALDAARARHSVSSRFAEVLERCSFLVDGQPVGRRDPHSITLTDGSVVEVLPPFAGGSTEPGAP